MSHAVACIAFLPEISVCAVVALMLLIGAWGGPVDSANEQSSADGLPQSAVRGKLNRSALSVKQRERQEELLNALLDEDFEKRMIGRETAPVSELLALADARRDDSSGTTYFFRLPAQHSPEGPGGLMITVSSDPPYVMDVRSLTNIW